MMSHRLVIAIQSVLITAIVLPAGLAQVPRHWVSRVSAPDAQNACEVSISINPTNPSNLIGVSMQRGRAGGPRATNFAYVTTDSGHSWKTVAASNPRALVQGDDAVTFDSAGNAYWSFISFDGIFEPAPRRAHTGIFVGSSSDGGTNWREPVPVVDHINSVMPFEDKPYIKTDNVVSSPYRNNVYVAWTRFDEYGSKNPECKTHIEFSRSNDGGRSFSPPMRISESPGDCVDSDNTVEGAVPAVGTKGEVYVVWGGPKGLTFDKSFDGGLTFGIDKPVEQTPGGWDIAVPGINRHNGMPVTAVDRSSGPFSGSLYVNWIDERNGDPDVFIISSRDRGTTWLAPVRVNDDVIKNGKAQFFTWLAVDPIDGSLNVVFFDRRDHGGNLTGLTMARSIDGGRTFVNYKVDQPPFDCNSSVFFGDYLCIDAYDGLVAAIYTHFLNSAATAVSAAVFKFKPGTQEVTR